MELLTILPNLSIGVVAIGALYFVTVKFLEKLDARAIAHELAMREREEALREVERDVRKQLTTIVSQTNTVISENTRVLGRVIRHLDGGKH